jgi:hypothetical protein
MSEMMHQTNKSSSENIMAMNLWAPLAGSVRRVLERWDVLMMAVDQGWGEYDGEKCRDRLISDCILNFEERWATRAPIENEEITNFLILTMEDLFDADVDFAVAFPVGC